MTREQIEHMVNRFLSWKLPQPFRPDNGISYAGKSHPNHPDPTGTNLFSATEAEAMVRHMVEGLSGNQDLHSAKVTLMAHGYTVTPPQGEGRPVPPHGSGPGDPLT